MVNLGIFGRLCLALGRKRCKVEPDRSSAKARREHANGSFCHTISQPSESDRAVSSKAREIDGTDLYVSGIDMVDNTPIYDIKPYLPHIDAIPDALGGFAVEENGDRLNVEFPDELLALIPESKRNALIECLRGDPRPSYQAARTDGREYGFPYAGFDVKFVVHGTALTVTDIK